MQHPLPLTARCATPRPIGASLRWLLLLVVVYLFRLTPVAAQGISYSFAAGTGASLATMTGSTQMVGPNVDDAPGAAAPIGFSFMLAGTAYSHFSASPDGFVYLSVAPGATASSAFSNSLTSTTNNPKLAPYWDDLRTGTTGKVHYLVTGAAPNRRLVIEWFVSIPWPATGAASARFQAWLDEGTNAVRYVYGTGMVATTMSYSVGLTGPVSTDFLSISTATNTSSTSAANNTQNNAITSGTIYTLTPSGTTCNPPTSLAASNVTPTSATISFAAPSPAPSGGYEYYVSTGTTTGPTLTTAASTINLTGLTPGQTYNFRIRSICGGSPGPYAQVSFQTPASITSFAPTSGAPGTTVTITGIGLSAATAVRFNGVTASFAIVNSTTLTAVVPANATTGRLNVTLSATNLYSATSFTVTPIITSFTAGYGSPGAMVVVTGLNFTSGTTLKFNGVAATTTYNSSTQLTATVPVGATTGPLTATNTTGSGASATNFIVTSGPAPTITSFSPLTAPVNSWVTITGTNLTSTTVVKFNSVATSNLTVLSSTQVKVLVPANATTGKISVTTSNGMAQSAASFTIIPPPSILTFSPASGAPGSVVLLDGSNFTSGVSSVKFNGVAASFTVNSAMQITATVPAGATTGRISVSNVAGTGTSSGTFTISTTPAPAIGSVSPASGPRGSTVVLTGANFSGVTSVKVNTAAVTAYTINSTTQITLTVPASATTGKVFVMTAGGMAQSAGDYTVILTPYISAFSPTSGPVGTTVTIAGTNFTGATSVTFGTTTTTNFTLVSATKITVAVPAGATTGTIKVNNAAGTGTSIGTFTVTVPRPAASASSPTPASPVTLEVFPNPAREWADVRVSDAAASQAVVAELLDGLGRVVVTTPVTDGTARLSLKGVAPGIYVVRLGDTRQRLIVE